MAPAEHAIHNIAHALQRWQLRMLDSTDSWAKATRGLTDHVRQHSYGDVYKVMSISNRASKYYCMQ